MTHSEYMEWVIEIGCGWLGWNPDEVRKAHLAEIPIALKGKVGMLQACFGAGEKKKVKTQTSEISSDSFDDIVGAG